MTLRALSLLLVAGVTPAAAQFLPDSLAPCTKVPAAAVQAALHTRVTYTRSAGDDGEARCRYHLRADGPDTTSQILILRIQGHEQYDGLKESAPAAALDVPGVGDAAHTYIAPDTKRVWVTAVTRGRYCVTVSGPDLPSVRALVVLALARYR